MTALTAVNTPAPAAVSIDPAFWDKIIGDIAAWGVETYEQDWLEYKSIAGIHFWSW